MAVGDDTGGADGPRSFGPLRIATINNIRFGICFNGSLSPKRTVALCKQAEAAGFTHAWFYDSHILWRDPYPCIAACLMQTETMHFGPCVTNPDVRD